MRATADAITQCKFEATDPAADEVVLYNILQVFARHNYDYSKFSKDPALIQGLFFPVKSWTD